MPPPKTYVEQTNVIDRAATLWNRRVLPALGLGFLIWFIFNPTWREMMGYFALAALPAMIGMRLFGLGPRVTLAWLMVLIFLVALAMAAILYPAAPLKA